MFSNCATNRHRSNEYYYIFILLKISKIITKNVCCFLHLDERREKRWYLTILRHSNQNRCLNSLSVCFGAHSFVYLLIFFSDICFLCVSVLWWNNVQNMFELGSAKKKKKGVQCIRCLCMTLELGWIILFCLHLNIVRTDTLLVVLSTLYIYTKIEFTRKISVKRTCITQVNVKPDVIFCSCLYFLCFKCA